MNDLTNRLQIAKDLQLHINGEIRAEDRQATALMSIAITLEQIRRLLQEIAAGSNHPPPA